jgi:hypothetical protein
MGFYLLPKGTHKKMDGVRSKFFWQGANEDFKYHMVRWEVVCRPKKFGGLGLINTFIFNKCLMTKWIWKIYSQRESLWVRILKAKYMRHGDFFRSSGRNGSQFWKSLHCVKHLFKWGTIHKVGNGKLTQFRNDVWLTSTPLRIEFHKLFAICADGGISVASCAGQNWEISFRRMLGKVEMEEWGRLQNLLNEVSLSREEDQINWGLSANKVFSTKSLYRFLTSGG